MAKAMKKAATSPKKCACATKESPLKKGKAYTKSQLIAHLVATSCNQGLCDCNRKAVAALVEELVGTLIKYAEVGAALPGIGKLVLKKTPARPARMGRDPRTGEPRQFKAKPAGKKLVFRISKKAKIAAGIVK